MRSTSVLSPATNRELKQEVKQGRFREDLYFRLNVFPVETVPLRDRREDIPLLAQHFLSSESKSFKSDLRLSEGDVRRLMQYDWPGNVRELQNVIERAAILPRMAGCGSICRFSKPEPSFPQRRAVPRMARRKSS